MDASNKDNLPAIPPALGPATAKTDGMTVVKLGNTTYHIHKALLTFHSEYFRKALQGPWKEADEGVVRLDDVGTEEFNIFVHWLYTQQLPTTLYMIAHISAETEDGVGLTLVKAYTLGDRLLAFTFRRAVNNLIVGACDYIITVPFYYAPVVKWAFDNIPPERPLLQFLVNNFCSRWDATSDDDLDLKAYQQLPTSFMLRAMRRYSLVRELLTEAPGCFAEHASEVEEQTCEGTHPEYAEPDGYSYIGKLDQ